MKMIHKEYNISTNSGESGLGENRDGKLNEDNSQGVQGFNYSCNSGEAGLGDNRDCKLNEDDSQRIQDFN